MKAIMPVMVFICALIFCLPASAQEQTPPVQRSSVSGLMAEGKRAIQQNEFERALELFEQVLILEPSNPEALYNAGSLYLRMNNAERGLEYLARSAQLVPENYRLRMVLAQAYESLRLVDQAITEYRGVVGIAPNTPEGQEASKRGRILVGKKYGEQGDLERALQIFMSVLADYPDDVPVLIDAGLSNLFLNRFDEAQAHFEHAIKLQPDNPVAHSYLADIYDRKGDIARAEEHYQRVLELMPMGSAPARQAQFKLSMIHGLRALENGQLQDAASLFEEAVSMSPDNPLARLNLATAYRGIGKQKEAEVILRALLDEKPNDLDARLRYGALLFEEGELIQAARELEEVLIKGRGGPQARQAAQFLGELYKSEQGKEVQARILEERIDGYKAILAQEPDNRDAWLDLAVIYLNQRRIKEAIDAFENVMRIDPTHGRVQHTLAELYDEMGDYAKAVPAFARALDLAADEATREKIQGQIILAIAKKNYNEGRQAQAKLQFQTIVKSDPNNFVSHFFLGLIYSREEDLESAVTEYKEVLRVVPSHIGARLNLAMLYEQLGREEDAIPEYRAVMRSGAGGMAEAAKKRLDNVQQRIDGFSYRVSYGMNWDNNSNLSANHPVEEFRSDLSGGITYRRKLRGKKLTWGVSYNPAYNIYHNGQYDFVVTELAPFVTGTWRGYDLSATFTMNRMEGLLNEALVNDSSTLSADAIKRIKMRPLLPFLASGMKEVPSALQISANARQFKSDSSPLFNSNSYSMGALINQSLADGWSWTGNYAYTDNSNTLPIGNDFAYTSHSLSLQLSKMLRPGLSMNGGYNYVYSQFKHPDSSTRFLETRVNSANFLSLGLNLFLSENLRLFANYSFQMNSSNLPTGFIFTSEDVAVGVQSPSLGDYQKHTLGAGVAVNF